MRHRADVSNIVSMLLNKSILPITRNETLALEKHWPHRIIKRSLYIHQSSEQSLNDGKFKLNAFE